MNIVLFKRDLRISDHQPLMAASKIGEFLPLYIFEPSEWTDTTLSARHFQFVLESLDDLSSQINGRGGELFIAIGELKEILSHLLKSFGSLVLYVHDNYFNSQISSFKVWADQHPIQVKVYSQIPPLHNDRLLKRQWISYIKEPVNEAPKKLQVPGSVPEPICSDLKRLKSIKVKGSKIRFGQQGGESRAVETLDSFLTERFKKYSSNIKKPIASSLSSSRLSAYLAWGNLSVRAVCQKTNDRMQMEEDEDGKRELQEFLEKLYVRERIILKMKDRVPVEFKKRKSDDEAYLRWLQGKTGIPIIDAAMRYLVKTGWLNFTFREMVLSFICNTMMLDCEKPAVALAKLFLDHEPSLHDYYVQRIGGASAKIKIINPIKTGKLLDPDGSFIRRYVPEISMLPERYIHEPWLYPGFYQLDYVLPIVDVAKANKAAKLKLDEKKMPYVKSNPKKNAGSSEQLFFDL